jgi:excisionase family DNA binding protein
MVYAGEKFLRTSDVAKMLHVSPKTVSRWAKEGRIPHLSTLGGHRRFPATEIERLMDELSGRREGTTSQVG